MTPQTFKTAAYLALYALITINILGGVALLLCFALSSEDI